MTRAEKKIFFDRSYQVLLTEGELKEKDCLLVFWAICWNRPRMATTAGHSLT
jgi:hypothetical protein